VPKEFLLPQRDALFDENVEGARVSADTREAIGWFNRGLDIATGDSGSHIQS